MPIFLSRCLVLIAAVGAAGSLVTAQAAPSSWTQWGGPTRDTIAA